MNLSMEKRNNMIDVAKFVAAIMVILIHTPIFSEGNVFVWQFDAFLRLAVPFFVMCSGYYLAERCEFEEGKMIKCISNKKKVYSFLRKICWMYIVWSFIYLIISIPVWIEAGWFSFVAFVDWGIAFFIKGSYFHLWYLLFVMYAVVFMYMISQNISIRFFPLLIIPLYLIEVIQYGYRVFISDSAQNVLAIYDRVSCLSAITRVLPFLLLGMYISYCKKRGYAVYVMGFIIAIVCLMIERNFLRMHGQESVSYIFGTLPASYFLFQLILNCKMKWKDKNFRILSQMSSVIYTIHPLLFIIIDCAEVDTEIVRFVLCLLLSIICSFTIIKFQEIIKRVVTNRREINLLG